MANRENRIPCIGCGARVLDIQGPTHRYIGASPGCWAVFGDVLAREYSDVRYSAAHRLTVDAYAAQHPGTRSRQSIPSVAVHLVGLYVVLERGCDFRQATEAVRQAANRKRRFAWLDPPASIGVLTILDVQAASDPIEHVQRVERWATSVWTAWVRHHATVRLWAEP